MQVNTHMVKTEYANNISAMQSNSTASAFNFLNKDKPNTKETRQSSVGKTAVIWSNQVHYSDNIPQIIENVKSNSEKNINLSEFKGTDLYEAALRNVLNMFLYSHSYGYGTTISGKRTWHTMKFKSEEQRIHIAEELLAGKSTIGAVPVSNEGVKFIAFDIDGKDIQSAYKKTLKLTTYLQDSIIGYVLSYSGSKGFHVFIPIDTEPYSDVKDVIYAEKDLLNKAGLVPAIGKNTYDENAVEIRPMSKGLSFIKLPFSMHLNGKTQEQLLDPFTFRPLTAKETLDLLANTIVYKVTSISSGKNNKKQTNRANLKSKNKHSTNHQSKNDIYKRYYKPLHSASRTKSKLGRVLLHSVSNSSKHSANDPFLQFASSKTNEQLLDFLHLVSSSSDYIANVRDLVADETAMIDLFHTYGIKVPYKAGKTFKCPFHEDNTPSVTISISRDGRVVHFNDWHNKGEKPSYNISDIRASLSNGKLMWVKNNQHMMRHLILAAVETGRVTANAKRLATKLLGYYKVLVYRKVVQKKVLTNSLKIMALLVLQAYTGEAIMMSAKYIAKLLGRSAHSTSTKILKYLAMLKILRVRTKKIGKDGFADMYSINRSAHPEDVDNRISLLKSHGLTNISKITQRDVALLFGMKFMQSIFYVYSMNINDSEDLIASDSMFAAANKLKEQTVKIQIHFAVNAFKLRLLLDYVGPPLNSG